MEAELVDVLGVALFAELDVAKMQAEKNGTVNQGHLAIHSVLCKHLQRPQSEPGLVAKNKRFGGKRSAKNIYPFQTARILRFTRMIPGIKKFEERVIASNLMNLL